MRFVEPIECAFDRAGHVPLPPYIHAYKGDPERYQTVFNKTLGSAAAPTAGLHFTPALLEKLKQQGVGLAKIDLHVGLDTFAQSPRRPGNASHHKECARSGGNRPMIPKKATGGRVWRWHDTVRTRESAAARRPKQLAAAGRETPTSSSAGIGFRCGTP